MTANSALPRVSVVIPTHNPRADYLARAIEALRQQTLPREQWELLVVDNGSRVPLAESTRQTAGGMRSEGESIRQTTDGKRHETSLPSNLATSPPYTAQLDLSWHANARVVREDKLGLTYARLRGFEEAKGELIIMVDDDNELAPDYLETAVRIAHEHPMLGAFGGKCLPEFEVEPEAWLKARGKGLGLRDRGEEPQLFPEEAGERGVSVKQCFSEAVGKPELLKNRATVLPNHRGTRRVTEFPDCAPIGAGMVLRREAAAAYAERIAQRACGRRQTADGEEGASVAQRGGRVVGNPELPKNRITEPRLSETALRQPPNHRAASVITDRRGDSLASGGDNDICLTVVEEGLQVGYLPQLQLTHLIPRQRMTLDYHRRMARDSMKSFILMLDQHGIRPWPAMPKWTYPLRVASDWWRVKPWRGPDESISWWGNIGMYEGRAALPQQGTRH